MIDLKKKSRRAINKRYLSAEDIYFPASDDCWAAFDVCVASCTLQLFTRPTHKHTHPANHLYLLLLFFLLSLLCGGT